MCIYIYICIHIYIYIYTHTHACSYCAQAPYATRCRESLAVLLRAASRRRPAGPRPRRPAAPRGRGPRGPRGGSWERRWSTGSPRLLAPTFDPPRLGNGPCLALLAQATNTPFNLMMTRGSPTSLGSWGFQDQSVPPPLTVVCFCCLSNGTPFETNPQQVFLKGHRVGTTRFRIDPRGPSEIETDRVRVCRV